jgi:hypothetical protein
VYEGGAEQKDNKGRTKMFEVGLLRVDMGNPSYKIRKGGWQ